MGMTRTSLQAGDLGSDWDLTITAVVATRTQEIMATEATATNRTVTEATAIPDRMGIPEATATEGMGIPEATVTAGTAIPDRTVPAGMATEIQGIGFAAMRLQTDGGEWPRLPRFLCCLLFTTDPSNYPDQL